MSGRPPRPARSGLSSAKATATGKPGPRKPGPRKPVADVLPAQSPAAAVAGERVAKALARAGVASRRDAEKLIAEGRIAVNGRQLLTPATLVGPKDTITLDGKPVDQPEAVRVWRYHKPAGLVTTHRDPAGRPTVFEHLPEGLPRVISVGRLDLNTEGLLLLTNDGALARALELPATGVLRRYRARAFGRADVEQLARLREGITVDGVAYGPVEAILERAESANVWLTVSLREGRNREVRTVLEAVGLTVNRLIRVSYGPFQLGNLPAGEVEEVPTEALPEMLGRLMPAAPVRGMRAPAKPASGASAAKGAVGRDAPGKTPAAKAKPAGRAAKAGSETGAGNKGPRGQRGKRRMDPFAEEAAINAALAARKQGRKPAGPGKPGKPQPGGRPGNRAKTSTTPRRPRP